jgi:hypothetical protein
MNPWADAAYLETIASALAENDATKVRAIAERLRAAAREANRKRGKYVPANWPYPAEDF